MSRTGRSTIHSVLTARDLESFVETFKILERFSPTLPGPDDSAEYTPDRIVLYTLLFSSCGVCYPLSSFKVDLLRHFKVHFSQLHPLGFMRVVHFELSCLAVSGEPSIPLFCMFYKLVSDGDWFTFTKRKDNISQPCYSFMPTSTYPKEWKSRFIFVSAAMMSESPPLRDAKAAIEDSIPVLSADEIVQWKRMRESYEGFYFSRRDFGYGRVKSFLSSQAQGFCRQERYLLGLLQGDCKDVQFVVGDKVEPGLNRGAEKKITKGSVQEGESAAEERGEEASSGEKKGPLGSLQVRSSSDDDNDEDLESRLVRKRKAAPPSSPKQVPVPRDIRLRLRSASGQKAFSSTRAASELPPTRVKGSLTKHLRSSSLVSEPLLLLEFWLTLAGPVLFCLPIPLSPLFADALPVPYIPRWKFTQSSVVGTPKTARDFLAHAVPPSHRFMNFAPRDDLFDDQYSMSLCEGLFRGVGMLQRVDELRRENEGLKSDLKTSQTVAAELVRWLMLSGAGVMLEQKERACAREMKVLVEEKEELAAELKHQRELDSVSQKDLDAMYVEYGMTSDDNQKLAKEKYWLITEGFGAFLTAVSQSEKFKGSLEQIYRAYQDVGY
ncbi:hypothetical protein HanRHA438_Chr05g0241681 [Helianthus annuus]|uniref:Transposase (putative) gypsy type domain-containing protein n=1 Tax=Helianthus annuus TaxID=4232 RepID=A0A9K3J2R3_HELAN|nr:hypothetical protein HanXRQr2_Chr05g0232441 [Helianthus annuus]KAJ0585835.1 hypothetical protein HanHA89_Chr05g0205191 [Helianthus annuus]KAJ0920469.1 hypothetical protein HanRHA438_Chr05g0241681 [Helianthus annuus]KAJ0924086.1 hypothetical protein HanPSC8_Chr05g0224171 [Helianthus annuus]